MRPTGLLSVTFRQLSFEHIINLASKAKLDGIEWGGDVHVLPGDIKEAERIKKATLDAGLKNFSYGSYWRANSDPEIIAETAAALGVQWIRVWAGTKGSSVSTKAEREKTIEYLQKLCRCCPEGIQVASEWHCHTLNDCVQSGIKLLEEVNEDNFFTYFQREVRENDRQDNLKDLLALPIEKIRAVHVHYCIGNNRLPLSEGQDEWQDLFAHIPENIPALLEFVRNDSLEQFMADSVILRKLSQI